MTQRRLLLLHPLPLWWGVPLFIGHDNTVLPVPNKIREFSCCIGMMYHSADVYLALVAELRFRVAQMQLRCRDTSCIGGTVCRDVILTSLFFYGNCGRNPMQRVKRCHPDGGLVGRYEKILNPIFQFLKFGSGKAAPLLS